MMAVWTRIRVVGMGGAAPACSRTPEGVESRRTYKQESQT